MKNKYNTDGIRRELVTRIEKASKSIARAQENLKNIEGLIPDNFNYSGDIKKVKKDKIPGVKSAVDSLGKWLGDKANEFEKMVSTGLDDLKIPSLDDFMKLLGITDLKKETGACVSLNNESAFLLLFCLMYGDDILKKVFGPKQSGNGALTGMGNEVGENLEQAIKNSMADPELLNWIVEKDAMLFFYKAAMYKEYMENNNIQDTSALAQEIFQNDGYSLNDKLYYTLYNTRNGDIGIDQGSIKEMTPQEQKELALYMYQKYNFKNVLDAARVIEQIDRNKGVCSYASLAETIAIEYMDKPEEFKEKFGYDLYVKDESGYYYLNQEKLLADVYIGININDPNLFENDKDGKKVLVQKEENGKKVYVDEEDFRSLSWDRCDNNGDIFQTEYNTDAVNVFLNSKGINVNTFIVSEHDVDSTQPVYNRGYSDPEEMLKAIDEITKNNSAPVEIQLTFSAENSYKNFNINFYKDSQNKDGYYCCDGGHIVTVVGVENDKIVINTWGKKLYVDPKEMTNNPDLYYSFVLVNFEDI